MNYVGRWMSSNRNTCLATETNDKKKFGNNQRNYTHISNLRKRPKPVRK